MDYGWSVQSIRPPTNVLFPLSERFSHKARHVVDGCAQK